MSYRKDGKPRKSWVHTAETKQKLSDVHKGKTFTDEHKANLSNALKGRTAPNKGKPMSEETRERMRIAQQRNRNGPS